MRYKGTDSEEKTLWLDQVLEWGALDGRTVMTQGAATWFDKGTAWAVFNVDDVLYSVDVGENKRAKGP